MNNLEIKFRMWNAVKNDPSRSRYFYETVFGLIPADLAIDINTVHDLLNG